MGQLKEKIKPMVQQQMTQQQSSGVGQPMNADPGKRSPRGKRGKKGNNQTSPADTVRYAPPPNTPLG